MENIKHGFLECGGRRQTGRTTDLTLTSLYAATELEENVTFFVYNETTIRIIQSIIQLQDLHFPSVIRRVKMGITWENNCEINFEIMSNIKQRTLSHKLAGKCDFVFYDNAIRDILDPFQYLDNHNAMVAQS